MYNNKGFCNAFLVFILAKELSYHLVPNIGVDAYKEQGDCVLCSFVSCVHQYKVATVPEEKPLLPFFLVGEHKLALLSVLVVIPCPQEEFGCGGIMTPLLYLFVSGIPGHRCSIFWHLLLWQCDLVNLAGLGNTYGLNAWVFG